MRFHKKITVIAILLLVVINLLSGCAFAHPDNLAHTPQISPYDEEAIPEDTNGTAEAAPEETPAEFKDAFSAPEGTLTEPEYPKWEIYSQGENYVILGILDEWYNTVILVMNNENEVVLSHLGRNDAIIELENGLLLLRYSYGSSEPGYVYYDPATDRFSKEYNGDEVIAQDFGMIAYLDWKRDAKTGLPNNKIVIQSLFDPAEFSMEYPRSIPDAMIPRWAVKDAYFVDESSLYVTYYTGEPEMRWPADDFETCTEIIQFR